VTSNAATAGGGLLNTKRGTITVDQLRHQRQ